ncbi:ATPase involved in chromosome partitioning [Mycolicibacterium rhodesiae NBB3]|uniref:ATPase involved in chromosome partitioning n=1 Tax=Mycolicibacterium rhodesiae (strain NBB3) TaxID=710685 RepID=G8RMH6_MYCRN|nr:MinD/ParA family protein [Mycolicibacterium rhodesiae]AEV72473.1 ATPase involved in chromosome partitioning [Mycolicibacterium rhodesiae NBB3]
MTDRDDELRRKLGWTGPEETDYEPSAAESEPAPPTREGPVRPPVDFVPPSPADTWDTRDGDLGATSELARPSAPSWESGPPLGVREPERPGGSFRQPPQRFGPPPGTARNTGPLPPGAQPWRPAPEHQPPRPQGPPMQMPGGHPPQSTQPWFPGGYGPDPRMAPPASGSYADRIRQDDLVPQRRVPPSRGWRFVVYKATFGMVNLGRGPDEILQAQLEAKVRSPLRGHFKVGVMGKGGVGKTTVSASIGSVFAELRQDDRVVAIDADTAFGKLGSRVDPRAQGSYWELAADQHLETFADIRNRVGNNSAGLFVLAGEGTPARRRVLDPAIYREATARLDRYFTISIVDCSSTMDTPVTQEVLRDLDAMVVVSSPWVDGAAAAGQTLDWLAARGLTSLLQRTVVVLNDSDGHADKRTRSILAQQFSAQGQVVVEVPFDGHLRPGGVIDRTGEMSPATRRKFIEVVAALAEYYPTHDDRTRERY